MTPQHLALLPDGNRRWAKKHGLKRSDGHQKGLVEVLPQMVSYSFKQSIHTVTIQPFSTDNWGRSKQEIDELMKINQQMLAELGKVAARSSARFVHLGRRDRLPKNIIRQMDKLVTDTKRNKKHVLNVAFDYGGVDDILRAIVALLNQADPLAKLNRHGLDKFLDTKGQPYPNPDLIVRTAEKRLSGFMAYQAAYSEIYFSPALWPDFTRSDLLAALDDFSKRNRKFGR